ncbi:MAG: DUF763 domain-containing protein [Candidatus Diapherotrites archaeon]|nr:DUF763 domain-containing protein [Candidatus Diapherotrites archaeon]
MKTGIANLPLHTGKAPRWLFERMVRLSGAISKAIVYEFGTKELLKRFADPFWFQAFSCVLGFDWHSSGTTTTTCGALKVALKNQDIGFFVCGGKGRTSRKTLVEIDASGLPSKNIEKLKYASRLAAKVDNSCVQDNYMLYHHCFFFDENGNWAVVQQGMNENMARRYHWISDNVKHFVEPNQKIACDIIHENVLDLTAKDSREVRKTSVDIVNDNPLHLKKYFSGQMTLTNFEQLNMPTHHPVLSMDISKRGWDTLKKAYEFQPKNYEELVSLRGIGPKTLRALALISELIYGEKASWRDPVKYSFAHGGKDGFPYPVDRKTYDKSIAILEAGVEGANISSEERRYAIKRLHEFIS